MKKIITPFLTFVTLLAVSGILSAQSQVHPFEPPPSLKETNPASVEGARFALKANGAPQTCDPQGSVTRDGSIVSVKLNFVRADFTINNPDPTDPYKGEDPVTLRSYGGCKTGPALK